ncbi:MAG TPA: N-acetylmuramoyl-L-alanine amidase [Longimicrobiales bacterium]
MRSELLAARRGVALALAVGVSAVACAPERTAPRVPAPAGEVRPALPAIPFRDGPLALDLVYPEEGGTIAVRDSTFVFGSTGTGAASLTINGTPVEVRPNGAFLAFLPVPPDGIYRLEARTARETAELVRTVAVAPPPPSIPPGAVMILEESIYPRGGWVAIAGERIEVGFRGSPGGRATLVLPDGSRIPLVERAAEERAAWGREAFGREPGAAAERTLDGISEYRGFFGAVPLAVADTSVPRPKLAPLPAAPPAAPDETAKPPAGAAAEPGAHPADRVPVTAGAAAPAAARPAVLELVVGADTARAVLPLNLALVDPARPRVGATYDPSDPPRAAGGESRARPAPGGVFHYFWPDGTRIALTGERDGLLRARLTADLSAWISADEVLLLPAGTPPPTSTVGAVRMTPAPGWVDIRFTLDARLPFRVDEGARSITVTLYGATSGTDWILYGGLDPLVDRAVWSQPRDDEYRMTLHLTQAPWGYHAFWEGDDLVLRVRRPPAIDPDHPLRGLLIALDPGHPPLGAVGPTRLQEPDANLAIALALRPLLEEAGARVLLTRTDTSAVSLYDRTRRATQAGAHLFLSIHNNAFPDGVNPFVNNGTSTYYFFPQSVDLAQALQRELVRELRLRDLGIGRGDLAVVRHTWMPAALTETMFLMIPEQEAALRNPGVIDRIARAHRRAIIDFLRRRAEAR